MKYFVIPLLFFFFSSQQKTSLNGSYKLEYKSTTHFRFQNGIIVFEDSIYSMDLSKSLKSKGIVTYGKHLTFIDGGNVNPNLVLSLSTTDIEKDTISFQVHNKNGSIKNYLDISVNSGKLIKF